VFLLVAIEPAHQSVDLAMYSLVLESRTESGSRFIGSSAHCGIAGRRK